MRLALLSLAVLLAAAPPSLADVGVIVHEPIGPLGFFTRAGHVSTYLSNICPDASPVRMRLCHPGEHGGVVSKYTPFSEHEDYDWAIVPFEEYLHGFDSPALAPLITTRSLERAIQQYQFGPLFSRAMQTTGDGVLPDGEWKSTLATRFERTMYILSIETSAEDDAAIVAAFNAAPNKSRFNFFYRNCSDQAKSILALVLGSNDEIGDRVDGMTMETPKGLAKAMVDRALAHPEFRLHIQRYSQLPGSFPQSRDVLFPLENMYKSLGYAPYWYFEGWREVALGAMIYHQLLAPFSMLTASRDFISPAAAALSREQVLLRRRQDATRREMESLRLDDSLRPRAAAVNAATSERLAAIKKAKEDEVAMVEGSTSQWRELELEFRTVLQTIAWDRVLPPELAEVVDRGGRARHLSDRLFAYFEDRGVITIKPGAGAWMELPIAGSETAATGLSASQVLKGDGRLAVLILAAALDDNLDASPGRRETFARVSLMMRLLREAAWGLQTPHQERRDAGIAAPADRN
jgi:hypothetical protein